ncbi:hypothetical protein B0H16DRAFT_1797929 [Mycena metata]|uniref:Uncharacterized protein n=1 Tax=Mycena metata TaxID=1033252 RepID=A0AAD7HD82_9AGAR|nr:hypothetical protein B0H16DRAFT_1797929 [Mycena metata]
MAPKRKCNEREEAPPTPEEDELEEEGEVDPGAGGEAARLKLEATRKRKREHMQRKRAKDGEVERAKSKAAMRTFRNGLTGKAKADYLVRQNEYKAAYRQKRAEGAGPARRGRRIEDDPEDEDEPKDEGVEKSSPPPPPARSRALRNTKLVASSPQAKPPSKSAPKKTAPKKTAPKKSVSAAAPSKAGRNRKHTNDNADVDPPAPESEEEQEVETRRPKKRAKVPAKRKARAEGELTDAPTTEEETEYHSLPPLTMSLRGHPAPPQPTPPAPPQPTPPASSAPKPTQYHSVFCARGPRCCTGKGGRVPVDDLKPKHFTHRKWVEKHPFPFVTAQGTPVDAATFNAAMITCCRPDLRHYRRKLQEKASEPGILDTYLTEDEEPKEGERNAEEEQNVRGIDLETDELTPFLPSSPSPTLFGLRGMEDEDEESAEGFFDPDEPPRAPSPLKPALFGLQGMEDEDKESAEGFFDPNERPRALSPPKPFDSIIPTLASRAATPTLGDINRGPSRSPSPFPVSPERNALTPPEHNAPAPPEHNAPAPPEHKAPAPPEHNNPLIDHGSPAEVLDYGTPEEELEDGGEDEEAEAARLAKLRQNVHVAALQAYRASSQYDQRFDPLLYNPTAPTNLDTYNPNAGKERSTVEILQIKKEMTEGFEEGASGVVSAPSSAMEPLPEGWWDLPQMPWTKKDHAEREQKAKDGTWRRAFNSGTFFVTGVHVSRRDARAAARLLK